MLKMGLWIITVMLPLLILVINFWGDESVKDLGTDVLLSETSNCANISHISDTSSTMSEEIVSHKIKTYGQILLGVCGIFLITTIVYYNYEAIGENSLDFYVPPVIIDTPDDLIPTLIPNNQNEFTPVVENLITPMQSLKITQLHGERGQLIFNLTDYADRFMTAHEAGIFGELNISYFQTQLSNIIFADYRLTVLPRSMMEADNYIEAFVKLREVYDDLDSALTAYENACYLSDDADDDGNSTVDPEAWLEFRKSMDRALPVFTYFSNTVLA